MSKMSQTWKIEKQHSNTRRILFATVLVSLSFSTFLLLPSNFQVHATSSSAPILGGWGGTRLKDTAQNSSAPASLVFSGEKQSDFEQIAIRQSQLGYNMIRASFAPYCSVLYKVNYATPQDFMGNYTYSQLVRAVNIASYYKMWIVVDYHGYDDLMNSTLTTCWLNFWKPVVQNFTTGYSKIIWEPLNEPNNLPGGGDAGQTATLSNDYQSWINQARSIGDTHWVVVQNLCSYGCGQTVQYYWKDYPTVNDTTGKVFESLHTYMDWNNSAFGTTCTTNCTSVWNNSTAESVARSYYLDFLNETAWPILNTEGGTSCGTTCPYVVTGSAGYSIVSFHFVQTLINYEDAATPRINRLLWVASSWTSAGEYGSLNLYQWGTLITYKSLTTPSKATLVNTDTQGFQYPWDGSGFFARGRHWIFYINWTTSCEGANQNCFYYASSINGANWTTTNLGLVTSETPSVVTNGTHVFYVRYDGTGSTLGKALMFRVGALNPNGTITWQPETTIKPATSGQEWTDQSIRISTTGQAFVAYTNVTTDGGQGFPWIIHSNGTNYSAAWIQNTQLRTVQDQWRFSIVQLPSGQMYVLYWPWSGTLRGRPYSNGAWGNAEVATPSGTQVLNNAFGFSTGNSTVYAIWQELTSQKLQFASRTTSGTWNAPQTITVADTASNPKWTATYDPLRTKWYVIYYNYTLNQIYQYSGAPGNWSPKTQLYTTTGAASDMAIGSYYNTASITGQTYTMGIFWIQNDPRGDYDLNFAQQLIT